eukprot:906489-Pelagomonas_calceolata.AAC.4
MQKFLETGVHPDIEAQRKRAAESSSTNTPLPQHDANRIIDCSSMVIGLQGNNCNIRNNSKHAANFCPPVCSRGRKEAKVKKGKQNRPKDIYSEGGFSV